MSTTFTFNMTLAGYSTTSGVKGSTLANYTKSTSYKRFGASGSYATGYAVRASWPTAQAAEVAYLRSLDSSRILSIKMTISCSSVGYNITTRYGVLASSSGASITSASASTVSVAKSAKSKVLTITSFGVSQYGYAFGGTVSSASYATVSSITVTVEADDEPLPVNNTVYYSNGSNMRTGRLYYSDGAGLKETAVYYSNGVTLKPVL